MAEKLQTTEVAETPTSRTKPQLRKALAVLGLAATIGSLSPAVAAAAHKKPPARRAPAPPKETPAQKAIARATTSTVDSFATQILADYNQAAGGKINQGVAFQLPPEKVSSTQVDYTVFYPVYEKDIIEPDGTIDKYTQDGDDYELSVFLNVPPNTQQAPSTINPNDVVGIAVGQPLENAVFDGPNASPNSTFELMILGNYKNSDKNQWDLRAGTLNSLSQGTSWDYTAGAGDLNKGHNGLYAPLTMQGLSAETALGQAVITDAEQYVKIPDLSPLIAQLPPPTGHIG